MFLEHLHGKELMLTTAPVFTMTALKYFSSPLLVFRTNLPYGDQITNQVSGW